MSLSGPTRAVLTWGLVIATAATSYFASSWWALGRHLERSAASHVERLSSGWAWRFDTPTDIVQGEQTGLSVRVLDGIISGHRGDREGYISLNLRGERIDAVIFDRLSLRIYVSRPTELRLFHRESLEPPIKVNRAAPIPLESGWQTLSLSLSDLPWVSMEYDSAGAVVSGPEPSAWGGAGNTVATLRIHPAAHADTDFAIDFVRIAPATDAISENLPTLDLPSLQRSDLPRTGVVTIEPFSATPASVLSTIRSMENRRPAFAYRTQLDWPGIPAGTWLVAALVSLVLSLAVTRRRPLLLMGLLFAAAYGLGSDPGASFELVASAALCVAAAAALYLHAISDAALERLIGGWGPLVLLTVGLLVPLALVRVFADGATPTMQQLLTRLLFYLPWAALQQILLQWILIPALGGHGRRRCRAAGSFVFGLLHFPNFALMVATLLLGGVTAHHYRRFNALVPVTLLHAILGTLYLELAPARWLLSGAVGMRFFGAY